MPIGDNPINRKEVRRALAAGLSASMPTAQAVYGYQKSDFGQQSPVVRVYSSGAERPSMTAKGIRSKFFFTVEVWVLFGKRAAWSEEDAEDAIDTLEQELIAWIAANQVTAWWTHLEYARPSLMGVVTVGGMQYLVEEFSVAAQVYG